MTIGGDFEFVSSKEHGAVLALADDIERRDAFNLKYFKDKMCQNFTTWYVKAVDEEKSFVSGQNWPVEPGTMREQIIKLLATILRLSIPGRWSLVYYWVIDPLRNLIAHRPASASILLRHNLETPIKFNANAEKKPFNIIFSKEKYISPREQNFYGVIEDKKRGRRQSNSSAVSPTTQLDMDGRRKSISSAAL
ncbi:hypothetical protein M422DRAFT_265190 [Sphaerobolus stellatus SS14]|uniref:Uncharacterized protein n=1 Tax=Sphaerobolus stellatus (strain SS14) TaxID=990650 RepID=A0A0C9UUS2_SPHS4|nr:hypothetical protein M422DRAFT_265190 [Sphaerobolus stellatus SS14]